MAHDPTFAHYRNRQRLCNLWLTRYYVGILICSIRWLMSKGLKRCEEVFNFLKTFRHEHSRMPTRKELCYEIKIAPGAFDRIVVRLIAQGKLQRITNGMPYRILK